MDFLKEHKTAYVRELAHSLYASEATIRRDLAELKKMGLIERSHGGAVLPENADEISMFVRINKNAREKERAASVALKILPDFKTVFIDSSSTALALAARMDLSFKTVVTNNLQTAMQLSKKPNVTLILLGGSVQFNTNSATGSWTTRQLEDFSFDHAVVLRRRKRKSRFRAVARSKGNQAGGLSQKREKNPRRGPYKIFGKRLLSTDGAGRIRLRGDGRSPARGIRRRKNSIRLLKFRITPSLKANTVVNCHRGVQQS